MAINNIELEGLKPVNGTLIVKEDDPEAETTGGIFLVDDARERPFTGVVIAVSDYWVTKKGVKVKTILKPGMRIAFGEYSGLPFTYNDELYRQMKESEVIAIYEVDE